MNNGHIGTVNKTARLVAYIQKNQRTTVRGVQSEFGVARSTAYRLLKAISSQIPIKIENGIILHTPNEK